MTDDTPHTAPSADGAEGHDLVDPHNANRAQGPLRDHGPFPPDTEALPAGVPPRAAFVGVFVVVVLAGFFGAVIGYGLADLLTNGDSPAVVAVGTLIGAVGAATGVGVVATLMLRAMSEWHGTKRRAR